MKKLSILSLALGLVLALPAFGQTYLSQTTLSGAVSNSTTFIPLASVSGIVATQTVIYVADGSGEAMFVNSLPGGKTVAVTRGYQNLGGGTPHNSGALVLYGPANAFLTTQPTGACSRSTMLYLPAIALGSTGAATSVSDCLGGVWVNGVTTSTKLPYLYQYPNPGGVANASLGTSTATVAGTVYCTEIDLPANRLVTGLAPLLGTTGGTDKHLVILYDSAGNEITSSAVAGQTAGTASTYEQIPFTAPYYMVGPAQYFGCVQSNGTTAKLALLAAGTQDQELTYTHTGSFGTIPATITAPTSFTTLAGTYMELY